MLLRCLTISILATLCIANTAVGQLSFSHNGSVGATEDRLLALEAEVATLRAANVGHQDSSISPVQPTSPCQLCPTVASSDSEKSKFPTARLTGFFQADAGWIQQDADNISAVGDIQDGADFRRARLAATGDVASNVGYMVEFDFGFPGRPSFMDVWLEVRGLSMLNNVKIGQFRQPFGLDGLTSAKELTFIERGLPFAFLPFRQIGAMTSGSSDDWGTTWAVSGFRFPTDQFGGQVGDNGGYGMAARLTGVIVEGADDSVLHIGGAYSLIDPANDAVRYRSQPEFFIAETGGAAFVPAGVPTQVPPFVDTGVIATDLAHLFGVELAATSGSLHGQAEAIYANVDRPAGGKVVFSGVSAQAGYILTGEHRPYNRKNGVLGRVVPCNNFGRDGIGAWEIAARWSMLDLNSNDIRGGRMNTTTLGTNWYLNKYTKFQFNYIHAFLNSPANGDNEADVFAMRAQIDF